MYLFILVGGVGAEGRKEREIQGWEEGLSFSSSVLHSKVVISDQLYIL